RDLNTILEKKYDAKNLVLNIGSYEVNLNNALIADKKISPGALKYDIINWLQQQPGVMYAVDSQNAQNASVPEWIRPRIINGYNRERSGAIQVILKPGSYSGAQNATSTTHGSWSPYDTHIPLV